MLMESYTELVKKSELVVVQQFPRVKYWTMGLRNDTAAKQLSQDDLDTGISFKQGF